MHRWIAKTKVCLCFVHEKDVLTILLLGCVGISKPIVHITNEPFLYMMIRLNFLSLHVYVLLNGSSIWFVLIFD